GDKKTYTTNRHHDARDEEELAIPRRVDPGLEQRHHSHGATFVICRILFSQMMSERGQRPRSLLQGYARLEPRDDEKEQAPSGVVKVKSRLNLIVHRHWNP